jgi:hypothetical protein
MNQRQTPIRLEATTPPPLRIFEPGHAAAAPVRWKINGHPTRLIIWSAEEWDQLKDRPADAQFHPSGVWCALRVD